MSEEINISISNGLATFTLNRPKALNALSLEMIRVLDNHLDLWQSEDSDTKAVLIHGAGERAFCAGGDVVNAYMHGMNYHSGACPLEVPVLYFKEEYRMNAKLYEFPKPYIAYLNGITMGGGFGVSAPGETLITCENTMFAMPEIHIGLFPDVGSMYYLHKLSGSLGLFLALTGQRLSAYEMHLFGLVKYHIPLSKFEELQTAIEELCVGEKHDQIPNVLSDLHESPEGESLFDGYLEDISNIFSNPSVQDICKALESENFDWAKQALKNIQAGSPTSLEITHEHWKRTKDKSFKDVVSQDFNLVQHVLMGKDFYIGVQEQVIDKTRNPIWGPNNLEDVKQSDIETYFTPSPQTLFDG